MVRNDYAPDRAAGVEFGDLERLLADHEFPTTGRELMEAIGDHRLEHQRGTVRLADLLEPLADETFESGGAVHQATLNLIGEEAVGREGYSDRDPLHRDEPGAEDRSF